MADNGEEPKESKQQIPIKDEDWDSVNQPIKNEDEDYEEAARSTADYASYESPQKPRNPIWKKLFISLLIIILLAGVAGAAYWYLKNHKSEKKPTQQANTSQKTETETGQITTETKHYDSSNFYLGLDYPKDWVVADSGGGVMTVTSPAMELKSASGENATGKIVVTIRDKNQKLTEFDSGNAVSAIDSQKINYVKPTQNQRGSTYITYVRYAGTSTSSGLDALYVTGDSGYKVAQEVPKTDIAKVDPIISVGFIKCNGNGCSGSGSPLTISVSSWNDKTLSGPVEAIIKSLAIT
jgi:hypothetical protein